MPIVGLGVHILVALFFAVHALRSGQPIFWLIILFSFPLLGSLAYFLAIYLPDSRLHYGARRAVASAAKALNPTRELREAQSAFEYTPTAQNRMRLAAAQLEAGHADEAARSYEACLQGAFATDLEIQLGAARAQLACKRYDAALSHLDAIRAHNPDFRGEQISLLRAQTLAALQRQDDARAEFEHCANRYGSFEAKAEYAIWAILSGERELGNQLQEDLMRSMQRWNRHTRQLNAPLLARLKAAQTNAAE